MHGVSIVHTPPPMQHAARWLSNPLCVCRTSSGYGPTNIEKSPQYVARLIKLVNLMSTRSTIQFFVQEVRYQPDK